MYLRVNNLMYSIFQEISVQCIRSRGMKYGASFLTHLHFVCFRYSFGKLIFHMPHVSPNIRYNIVLTLDGLADTIHVLCDVAGERNKSIIAKFRYGIQKNIVMLNRLFYYRWKVTIEKVSLSSQFWIGYCDVALEAGTAGPQLLGGHLGHVHVSHWHPLDDVTVAGGLLCAGAVVPELLAGGAHITSGQAIGMQRTQAGQKQVGGSSIVAWGAANAEPNAKAKKIMVKYFILATVSISSD